MVMTGYIYTWKCIDSPDLFYVGSTFNMAQRMKQHKQDYKKNPEFKYTIAKENGGYNNYTFEVVDTHECETDEELRIHEQIWIDKLNPIMNSYNAYSTQEETRRKNREWLEKNPVNPVKRKEYFKQYCEKNHDKVNEIRRLWREKNREKQNKKIICECGKSYTKKSHWGHNRTKTHLAYIEKKN